MYERLLPSATISSLSFDTFSLDTLPGVETEVFPAQLAVISVPFASYALADMVPEAYVTLKVAYKPAEPDAFTAVQTEELLLVVV